MIISILGTLLGLTVISVYLDRNNYDITPTEAKYALQDMVWSKILRRKKKPYIIPELDSESKNGIKYITFYPVRKFVSKLAPAKMINIIMRNLIALVWVGFYKIRYQYYVIDYKVRKAVKDNPQFTYLFVLLFIQFVTSIWRQYSNNKRKREYEKKFPRRR